MSETNPNRRPVPDSADLWWWATAAAADQTSNNDLNGNKLVATSGQTASNSAIDDQSTSFCAICKNSVDGANGPKSVRLDACGHRFHVSCAHKWLETRDTCYVCRTRVSHKPRQWDAQWVRREVTDSPSATGRRLRVEDRDVVPMDTGDDFDIWSPGAYLGLAPAVGGQRATHVPTVMRRYSRGVPRGSMVGLTHAHTPYKSDDFYG